MENYSVSKFDENNNLVAYVEYDKKILGQPKCFYEVDGRFLNRIHVNEDTESGVKIYESVNSFIEFNDNIMLKTMVINGETRLDPIISASTYHHARPIVVDRFDTYKELEGVSINIESFRLASSLIDDYVNKL